MGQQLTATKTKLNGVYCITSESFSDERGFFSRWFCAETLKLLMGGAVIRQINHSVNLLQGVTRGLHFQHPPAAEYKLVRCIRGKVFDVVVDLRHGSPTLCQHVSIELEAESNNMLLIPPGCAHGFQALEDDSQLLYLHSADYLPQYEGGCRVDDPVLKINWPLPITLLSERDANFPLLDHSFDGIML